MTGIQSRKERRKLERAQKKQNHHEKISHKLHDENESKPNNKRKKVANMNRPKKKRQHVNDHNKPVNRFMEFINDRKNKSITNAGIEAEDREIEHLSSKLGLNKGKSSMSRLNKEYEKDGLGTDFGEFLSGLDNISNILKKSEIPDKSNESESEPEDDPIDMNMDDDEDMDEETRREFELLQKEDAEFLKGMEDLPTDDEDDDDEENLSQFYEDDETEDEMEMDEEVRKNTLKNQQISLADQNVETSDDLSDDEISDQKESKSISFENQSTDDNATIKEDIYGRPINGGNISSTLNKYVPPHLRNQNNSSTSSTDSSVCLPENRELKRVINGQLNRLGESNMESITLEMEKIYRDHIRSEVNAILLHKIIETCCHKTQLVLPLITTCGGLIAGLHHSIGMEIGGFMVEQIVKKYMKILESYRQIKADKKTKAEEEGSDEIRGKEPMNLALLIGILYNFQVIHSQLILNIMNNLVDSFQEFEIEILLNVLKNCGHELRSDDSVGFNDLIKRIQEHAHLLKKSNPNFMKSTEIKQENEDFTEDQTLRLQFMLDIVCDLKKAKKNKLKNTIDIERIQKLKKWLGRVKSRVQSTSQALRINLNDLLNADKTGRWWIVGGTWIGYQGNQKHIKESIPNTNKDQKLESNLMKLAIKQRMNTETRRRIFVAIMGGKDYMDAYDRVIRLGLRQHEEREIVRVLIHCVGQERMYNPYYQHLSLYFCQSFTQNLKFTFQLAYYDLFKQIDELNPRKIYNTACLLSAMVEKKALTLAVLKPLNFTCLSKNQILFVRVLMERLLRIKSNHFDETLASIMERIATSKDATMICDGLNVFLHHHMNKFDEIQEIKERQQLKKRVKLAQTLLEQTRRLHKQRKTKEMDIMEEMDEIME